MNYKHIAIIAAATAIVSPAFANQGDTVTVGSVQAQPSGNTNPDILTASFKDNSSGITYNFFLEAQEISGQKTGNTTFGLLGPGFSSCTLHGGQGFLSAAGSAPFNYGGSMPFQNAPGCGTSFGQSISIHGCTAKIQAHGFMHSDAPNITYLGTTTIEVQYKKKSGTAKDEIEVTLYTPKDEIKLSGKVTSGIVPTGLTNCRGND